MSEKSDEPIFKSNMQEESLCMTDRRYLRPSRMLPIHSFPARPHRIPVSGKGTRFF